MCEEDITDKDPESVVSMTTDKEDEALAFSAFNAS